MKIVGYKFKWVRFWMNPSWKVVAFSISDGGILFRIGKCCLKVFSREAIFDTDLEF